jgi:amino acid adenylation domain-containing protein
MTVQDIEDIYELSPLQQGMLLHSLYDGDPDTYVAQRSFDIDGPLDPGALIQAWEQVIAAHTALRTSFHWGDLDKPLQVVHRDALVPVQRHDWSDVDDEQQRARFDQLLADDRARGFDPAHAPLQRLHLVRLGTHRHGFIWTHHMLLLDGWSVPIVLNDVVQRYRSLTAGGPPPAPPAAYRGYIAWLQGQDLQAAKDFWTTTLSGRSGCALAPLLPAPPDGRPGPVDERVLRIPEELVGDLRVVAARHQVTGNTVLQAAWALVLQRYGGEAEVTFGCASSGRPASLPGIDRMVGSFINTLPIRLAVPGDGELGPWLREIQATHASVRRFEFSPLAQIKTWAGAPGPEPLFHSLVVFDNYPLTITLGDLSQQLSIRGVNSFEKTSQPLTLIVTPGREFTVRLIFHQGRFVPGSIDEMLDYLLTVLAAIPGAQRIMSVAAPRRPVSGDRAPAVRYADGERTLPALIERQAGATPDAVAVASEDGDLTYRALLARARQVGAAVARAGAGPGDVVAVCAERSLDLVPALLGVMLAGAAYLPLDPSLPAARLAFMVSDAGAAVVLAQRHVAALANEAPASHLLLLDELADASSTAAPPGPANADPAYVIYTSGSTGKPKGAVIHHAAIVNRLLWMQATFRLSPADRVLHKTPIGFDVSVWELFWPLIVGAAMVLARPGGHRDSEYLARTIARYRVTTAHFVPSMLRAFLDEPAVRDLPVLRRVICSGEQLTYPLAQRLTAVLPDAELHNLYGPTEAAVDITWWDCSRPGPEGVIPIGHPIANSRAHVLDTRMMEAPADVAGELFLGGVQLARGYINQPALTAERFVAHALAGPGGRLYRTGDKALRRRDGSLEFLGRLDRQVKVRGHRIELAEIEQALLGHPAVREAVVVSREGPDGPRLAAYITAERLEDPAVVREHLRCHLPQFMLPASLTVLPALPLTHNGKVDTGGLPDPAAPPPTVEHQATPASPDEEIVAAVYRDILGLTQVNITASFFDLGGDSFAAIRAVRRIEGASVGLLAAHPSVRQLAAALRARAAAGILLPLSPTGPVRHTLVCVPFGGGSAISYRPLADALAPGTALLAVSLPGHDLGEDSDLRPIEDVARDCADAIIRTIDGPLSVYGHCVGVALAIELTRRLEAAGRPVNRLFVGGSYPFYEQRRFSRRRPESTAADRAEMSYLKSLGGFRGLVDDDDLAFIMRAFRHDASGARHYFSQHWSRRNRLARPLAAPITFVAGTQDPETPRYEHRYRMWRRFGADVELATVPGGGHYFLQHQPQALADIIDSTIAAADVTTGQ